MCNVIPVALTAAQYRWAVFAGVERQNENVLNNLPSKSGGASVEEGYDKHITGSVGEFVVSLALELNWPGTGQLKGADVGRDLQVRSTHWPEGRLRVHDYDADDAIFILVTGRRLHYMVRGWLYGHEAKNPDWSTAPDGKREAFFVPQQNLHPMSELRALLRSKEVARA